MLDRVAGEPGERCVDELERGELVALRDEQRDGSRVKEPFEELRRRRSRRRSLLQPPSWQPRRSMRRRERWLGR